jgi:hypothetical protein
MTPKGRHPVYGFIYTPINQFFLEDPTSNEDYLSIPCEMMTGQILSQEFQTA